MKISELLKDKYKLRIPPTVYYDLLADVVEIEEQEPTTKNDLGVDCISRADAIRAMQNKAKKLTNEDTINGLCGAVAILFDLPSVTPQEPKTGHWIEVHPLQEDDGGAYMCSECKCGGLVWKPTTYCPNCGCHMVEPQESEVDNGNDD